MISIITLPDIFLAVLPLLWILRISEGIGSKNTTSSVDGISSPSSATDVAIKILKSPFLNLLIISPCCF